MAESSSVSLVVPIPSKAFIQGAMAGAVVVGTVMLIFRRRAPTPPPTVVVKEEVPPAASRERRSSLRKVTIDAATSTRDLTLAIEELARNVDALRGTLENFQGTETSLIPAGPGLASLVSSRDDDAKSWATHDGDYQDAEEGLESGGSADESTSDPVPSRARKDSRDPTPEPTNTDPVATRLEEIDRLHKEHRDVEALAYVKALVNMQPEDPRVMWRLARAQYTCAQGKDAMAKKDATLAAVELVRRAVEMSSGDAEAYKWAAIIVGSAGEFLDIKTKINNGFEFKRLIEESIKLNPTDPAAHHLLGRFYYEIAILTWLERKTVATIFASPPEATIEDALGCFMKAEEISPGFWKANALAIAKCHDKAGDKDAAVEWLNKALTMPTDTAEDRETHEEVLALLGKLETKRTFW